MRRRGRYAALTARESEKRGFERGFCRFGNGYCLLIGIKSCCSVAALHDGYRAGGEPREVCFRRRDIHPCAAANAVFHACRDSCQLAAVDSVCREYCCRCGFLCLCRGSGKSNVRLRCRCAGNLDLCEVYACDSDAVYCRYGIIRREVVAVSRRIDNLCHRGADVHILCCASRRGHVCARRNSYRVCGCGGFRYRIFGRIYPYERVVVIHAGRVCRPCRAVHRDGDACAVKHVRQACRVVDANLTMEHVCTLCKGSLGV